MSDLQTWTFFHVICVSERPPWERRFVGTGFIVVAFSLDWWNLSPLCWIWDAFSVVSSRLSAQTIRIVCFVYLLFYRYWGADKNITRSIFWPTPGGSGLRPPSLDINLVPRKYSTGFKIMEAPVLCGFWIYFSIPHCTLGVILVILFLLIWGLDQQGPTSAVKLGKICVVQQSS